jgi:hypothetical protein
MSDEDFVTTTQQSSPPAAAVGGGQRRSAGRAGAHRYLVVPKEVGETDGLVSKMDNKFWRALEIVLKQKPARILLGAAERPVARFPDRIQRAADRLRRRREPVQHARRPQVVPRPEPDEREAVEAELGITHGHHFGMDEPHLGATNNHMVNFWRAYKKSASAGSGTGSTR